MPFSDKDSQDDHKNKTKQLLVWCEDCGKYISDKTRHFQSEIHWQKNKNKRSTMRSTAGVEIIVNEKKIGNETFKKIQLKVLNITWMNYLVKITFPVTNINWVI